jgi:hypothetical protein
MVDVLTVLGTAICPTLIAVIACYFYDFTVGDHQHTD